MSSERTSRAINYDLIIVGGGITAYILAVAATQSFARVALVPSSRLMAMATYQTDRLGNWVESLTLAGVDVLMGGGHFVGKQSFLWQGKILQSRLFVLAIPPQHSPVKIRGLGAVPYVTSEDFFRIERIPDSIAILGEDSLSCSIAQSLVRAGTKVTLLVPQNHILPEVDGEVSRLLQARLEIDGIDVLTNTTATAVDVLEDGSIKLWSSSQSIVCHSLYLPLIMEDYLDSLNLLAARIKSEAGMIIHTDRGQTTNPRVYLCHSVADIDFLLGQLLFFAFRRSEQVTPIVVNTDPGLGALGMTETAARRRYGKRLKVLRLSLLPLGFCKVLCLTNGKILGVHLLSDRAQEVIESIALIMKMNLTLFQLARHRFNVPSLITEIAYLFQNQIEQNNPDRKLRLLRWLALRREWNF